MVTQSSNTNMFYSKYLAVNYTECSNGICTLFNNCNTNNNSNNTVQQVNWFLFSPHRYHQSIHFIGSEQNVLFYFHVKTISWQFCIVCIYICSLCSLYKCVSVIVCVVCLRLQIVSRKKKNGKKGEMVQILCLFFFFIVIFWAFDIK